MPWRSRRIASIRSSRSAVSLPCCPSISRNSCSARRFTEPSRSRSCLMRSILPSTSAIEGNCASGLISATSATAAGSTCKISWISCSISASRRRARGFVGFAELALGFGQTVGRGAPCQRGGFDLADQTLPLGGKLLRRIGEFIPFRIGLVGAPTERGDLRRRIVAALAPGSPLVGDRREPVLGELRFARDRLRLAANFGATRALVCDYLVHGSEFLLDFVGGAEGGERLFGLGARGLSLGLRAGEALTRLLPCRDVGGVA